MNLRQLNRLRSVRSVLLGLIGGLLWGAEPLPHSSLWAFPEDIVAEQYRELRQYYDGEIAKAREKRPPVGDIAEFRRMLGIGDALIAPKPEQKRIARSSKHAVSLVSWPILNTGNVHSTSGRQVRIYGLLIEPNSPGPHPAVIAIPDATASPVDIAGFTQTLPLNAQYARRLAESGFVVFTPFFTQRRSFSQPWTDDRIWLFRLAYQVGRHVLGSEIQQISAACDYLSSMPGVDANRIGVAGSGQGGLLAFYAAAHDQRLKTALVANHFNARERAYDEPEDRTLWKQMLRFGDAEVANMIAP